MRRAAIFLLALASYPAIAQVRTVWQIGKFDDASGEFHDAFGVNFADKSSDVDYHVGTSTAADWMRFQPGPANGLAGGREHPYRIDFTLADAPHGTYTLKVAVLYETPRLSQLEVNINGHDGVISFHPELDWGAGDWEGTFVPQTSHAERDVPIPPQWLRRGENTIVLTAVDQPAAAQNSLGDIAPGETGLVYDALALLNDGGAYRPAAATPAVQATIFFRNSGSALTEDVRACLFEAPRTRAVRALALQLAGFSQTSVPAAQGEFGDRCVVFRVPEWSGKRDGKLLVDGRAYPITLEAQKKWTVQIVPHEHLDIGFTDYREKVAELQSESIDGVLDLLPQHPEFRWTIDGSWIAQQYLAGRSTQRVRQFLDAVKDGKIVLPPQFANQHTGVASLEGLTRSLYYSHRLAAENGLPVGAANITDVPSYSWSYASILHDAGIRYFAAGSNNWRAPILLQGRWNAKSPFYWEGPDGGRVLMWYSRAYLQLASMFGVPPTVEAVHDALPVFLQAYERPDYFSSSVILFGSQLENTALDRGQVTLPGDWQKTYAYPRLQFSTFKDSLAAIAHDFGDRIPTYRGDFGPYWEDGFTSGAKATAAHRANQQRLLNAEVLATIPSLLNPNLRPDEGLLGDAWQNSLLFDEHTWSAVSGTTQPEGDQYRKQTKEKTQQPKAAGRDIEYSIERSFAQLTSMIRAKQESMLVFNALPWARSGWLEADLPEGKHLVDAATGKDAVQQALRVEKGTSLPGFGGRTVRVRYRADDVPGVGYKLFSIADGALPVAAPAAQSTETMENRYYRIVLDPASGAIRSIWDKELQRELVDASSPYRFGAYLYVTGADDMPHNSLYRYGVGLPAPKLDVHAAGEGRVVSVVHDAGMQVATLESSAPNTPKIVTTIALPDDARRIELRVSLQKHATLHREAAYIAFPFAVREPSFAYDIQNGWVDPAKDELAGGSHEWYATQHWAAVHGAGASLGVICEDAPMVNFGDIVRGTWPEKFAPRSATIFSWLMSNYWSTNFFSSQGGAMTFRYAIVSGARFAPAELTRTSMEAMTPLESDRVGAQAGAASPAADSYLNVNGADVALTTWKRAEDGTGSIVRLVETAGKDSAVDLTSAHLHIESAQRCSLLEDCGEAVPVEDNHVRLTLRPHQIVTLKLSTAPVHP